MQSPAHTDRQAELCTYVQKNNMKKERITLVVEKIGLQKLDALSKELGISKSVLRRYAFATGVYMMVQSTQTLVKVINDKSLDAHSQDELRGLLDMYKEDEEEEESTD